MTHVNANDKGALFAVMCKNPQFVADYAAERPKPIKPRCRSARKRKCRHTAVPVQEVRQQPITDFFGPDMRRPNCHILRKTDNVVVDYVRVSTKTNASREVQQERLDVPQPNGTIVFRVSEQGSAYSSNSALMTLVFKYVQNVTVRVVSIDRLTRNIDWANACVFDAMMHNDASVFSLDDNTTYTFNGTNRLDEFVQMVSMLSDRIKAAHAFAVDLSQKKKRANEQHANAPKKFEAIYGTMHQAIPHYPGCFELNPVQNEVEIATLINRVRLGQMNLYEVHQYYPNATLVPTMKTVHLFLNGLGKFYRSNRPWNYALVCRVRTAVQRRDYMQKCNDAVRATIARMPKVDPVVDALAMGMGKLALKRGRDDSDSDDEVVIAPKRTKVVPSAKRGRDDDGDEPKRKR